MALSPLEISTFYQILDRGGSVLDFTRGTLDDYVGATIGVMPCEEYGLPMMKSLRACVKDLDDTQRVKLFSALLDYYEQRHKSEFTASPSGYRDSSYRAERAAQVHLCRKALEREKSGINPFTQSSERLKEQFSSEYMSQQIDALNTLRNENQSVIEDIFTMTMLADTSACSLDFTELSQELAAAGEKIGVSVQVQREDVFNFMYRL